MSTCGGPFTFASTCQAAGDGSLISPNSPFIILVSSVFVFSLFLPLLNAYAQHGIKNVWSISFTWRQPSSAIANATCLIQCSIIYLGVCASDYRLITWFWVIFGLAFLTGAINPDPETERKKGEKGYTFWLYSCRAHAFFAMLLFLTLLGFTSHVLCVYNRWSNAAFIALFILECLAFIAVLVTTFFSVSHEWCPETSKFEIGYVVLVLLIILFASTDFS